MTLKRNETVKCPKCGHEENVELWDTLNVSLDPRDKELLFQGKINLFVCSECDHHAFINIPLLYHDMRRRFSCNTILLTCSTILASMPPSDQTPG
jgi:transcription elongation factor Elf1